MAIMFDSVSQNVGCSGSGCVSGLTSEITIADNPNRILIVAVLHTYGGTDYNVYHNGKVLTQYKKQLITNDDYIEYWYRLNPDIGTNNITLAVGSISGNCYLTGINLYGVKQEAPEVLEFTNTGGDVSSISDDITTLTNGAWIVDICATDALTRILTPTSGQSVRADSQTFYKISTEEQPIAGIETVSYSINVDNDMALITTSLAPAVDNYISPGGHITCRVYQQAIG